MAVFAKHAVEVKFVQDKWPFAIGITKNLHFKGFCGAFRELTQAAGIQTRPCLPDLDQLFSSKMSANGRVTLPLFIDAVMEWVAYVLGWDPPSASGHGAKAMTRNGNRRGSSSNRGSRFSGEQQLTLPSALQPMSARQHVDTGSSQFARTVGARPPPLSLPTTPRPTGAPPRTAPGRCSFAPPMTDMDAPEGRAAWGAVQGEAGAPDADGQTSAADVFGSGSVEGTLPSAGAKGSSSARGAPPGLTLPQPQPPPRTASPHSRSPRRTEIGRASCRERV